MTERAAEDADVEALKVKHDAVERSPPNANTSVTTITVKAERSGFVRDGASCHREGTGDQGDGGEICVECVRERTEARDSARSDL